MLTERIVVDKRLAGAKSNMLTHVSNTSLDIDIQDILVTYKNGLNSR